MKTYSEPFYRETGCDACFERGFDEYGRCPECEDGIIKSFVGEGKAGEA